MKYDAAEILGEVQKILAQRGTTHGGADGRERNMAKCVTAFNAIYGTNLTTEQGWAFMCFLKFSRMTSGKFNDDDFKDLIGYTSLLAEEAFNENIKPEVQTTNSSNVVPLYNNVDGIHPSTIPHIGEFLDLEAIFEDILAGQEDAEIAYILDSIDFKDFKRRIERVSHLSPFVLDLVLVNIAEDIIGQIKALGGNPRDYKISFGCDDRSCTGCGTIEVTYIG